MDFNIWKGWFSLKGFIISISAASVLAGIFSWLVNIPFSWTFGMVIVAMLVNGLIASWEDN